MKKYIAGVVSGLIIIIAFALLIYPTPYRYLEIETNGVRIPVKVNVITGKTMIFTAQDGWEIIKSITPDNSGN